MARELRECKSADDDTERSSDSQSRTGDRRKKKPKARTVWWPIGLNGNGHWVRIIARARLVPGCAPRRWMWRPWLGHGMPDGPEKTADSVSRQAETAPAQRLRDARTVRRGTVLYSTADREREQTMSRLLSTLSRFKKVRVAKKRPFRHCRPPVRLRVEVLEGRV